MINFQKIIISLSKSNPAAFIALMELLMAHNGIDVLVNMKVELKPEDYWNLFKLCNEDSELFSANLMIANEIEPEIIHDNLSFKHPLLFVESYIDIFKLKDIELQIFIQQCKNNFILKYLETKMNS